jgi:ATP-dependent protease ClpP protease subunit
MKPVNRRWFSMKASETEAEISIFDEIGLWGITVGDFKKELDAVKDRASIKLLLNSPGGSVFDGMAIYNLLLPLKDRLTVHVLGLAASIASVIALAGKSVTMAGGTYFMIHSPWAMIIGTASEMRKIADLLESIGSNMADIYTARSTYTRDEVLKLMAEETWLTAEEAVDAGFADEADELMEVAALACDLSRFKHAPKALTDSRKAVPPATPRDLEALLRDAGYSHKAATGIVAKGFSALSCGMQEESGSGIEPTGEEAATPKLISPEKLRAIQGRVRRLALAS